MSEEFSLRALTREVWDDLGSADYHVLAKEVARRVTARHREAALNEALTDPASWQRWRDHEPVFIHASVTPAA